LAFGGGRDRPRQAAQEVSHTLNSIGSNATTTSVKEEYKTGTGKLLITIF